MKQDAFVLAQLFSELDREKPTSVRKGLSIHNDVINVLRPDRIQYPV